MVKQGHHMVPTNGGLKMEMRFCLKFQQAQSSSVPRYVVTEGFFLAPQSGALRINAYRDLHPSNPIHPLIAFEHFCLSMVIRNSASRPRQINVDQVRPKQVPIL